MAARATAAQRRSREAEISSRKHARDEAAEKARQAARRASDDRIHAKRITEPWELPANTFSLCEAAEVAAEGLVDLSGFEMKQKLSDLKRPTNFGPPQAMYVRRPAVNCHAPSPPHVVKARLRAQVVLDPSRHAPGSGEEGGRDAVQAGEEELALGRGGVPVPVDQAGVGGGEDENTVHQGRCGGCSTRISRRQRQVVRACAQPQHIRGRFRRAIHGVLRIQPVIRCRKLVSGAPLSP